jgi:hypothetical protein
MDAKKKDRDQQLVCLRCAMLSLPNLSYIRPHIDVIMQKELGHVGMKFTAEIMMKGKS